MTQLKELKNGLFYMLPVLVGNLLPIITLSLFTRVLTPQDYGVFALSQVYAIFVTGVANCGLSIGFERNFFEYPESNQRARLLYTVLLFSLLSLSFFAILTLAFGKLLAREIMGSETYDLILFLAFCSAGITSLKVFFLTYFKNTANAKAFAVYTVDENIGGVGLSLLFVLYFKVGVLGLVLGPLIAGVVVFLLLLVKFLKANPFGLSSGMLKEALKVSLPLTPKIYFGVIGTHFDKYMISLLGTVGGVGIYNIGQKLGYIVFAFMTAVQNIFSPQVYERMFKLGSHGGRSIGKYLTPYLYICIAAGLFVALFSEEAIIILTPPSYHGAIDVASVLALLYGTYFFGKQPQLIYTKKTGITSVLTIVAIALNVVINIPFIKIWGVMGAAYGTLLAGLISGLVSLVISQKYYNIKWEYSKVLAIYGLFFGLTLVSLILRNMEVSYGIRLVFKAGGIISFGLLGFKLGIVSKKAFDSVIMMLRPGIKPVNSKIL